MSFPDSVKIVEVGPRDGLQNEKQLLDQTTKVHMIEQLALAGLPVVEAGSFVSPKWVPQMANSDAVFQSLNKKSGTRYPILVPNLKGFEKAIELDVGDISCFTAASDTFNLKNINCTIDESLQRIAALIALAKEHDVAVRGYVSCIVGCPYQGNVDKEDVRRVVEKLFEFGCYEISLGDTIGVGTPRQISELLDYLLKYFSVDKLALHLHDTYGQALANIYAGLQHGVQIFDSSVAGLGGCPYADGASGNVATEDLVYMLNGLGIESGVDLDMLVDVGDMISKKLDRQNQSKVAKALLAKRKK